MPRQRNNQIPWTTKVIKKLREKIKKSLENKDMEICNLNDRELKISVLKKLNKIEENWYGQFNELRNKISNQKEYFIKKIEILKNNSQKKKSTK